MDSITLMADQLTVQFLDVPETFSAKDDILCKYSSGGYKIRDGDRIAVFRLGWKSLKSYVIFEWANEVSQNGVHLTTFNRCDIPSSSDLYQFCYISGSNVVQGISTPFQVFVDKKSQNMTDSLKNENQCHHFRHLLALKDQEILRLKEDNAILKESLKAVMEQNRRPAPLRNYEKDIGELQDLTQKLRIAFLGQQQEIEALKMERRPQVTKRLNVNFDLGDLQSLPPFPFEDFKN